VIKVLLIVVVVVVIFVVHTPLQGCVSGEKLFAVVFTSPFYHGIT